MRKSKMTKLLIEANELARKHKDNKLSCVLDQALDLFSELDAIVYGIELDIEKYYDIDSMTRDKAGK